MDSSSFIPKLHKLHILKTLCTFWTIACLNTLPETQDIHNKEFNKIGLWVKTMSFLDTNLRG
jgi:hypothetical protein